MAGSQAAGAVGVFPAASRCSECICYSTNTQGIVTGSAFSVDSNKRVSSAAKSPPRLSQQIRLLRLVVIGKTGLINLKRDSFSPKPAPQREGPAARESSCFGVLAVPQGDARQNPHPPLPFPTPPR